MGAVEHDDRTGIFAECINCVSSVARFRAAFAGGGMVRSERFGVKMCHVETVVRTVQVDDLFSRLLNSDPAEPNVCPSFFGIGFRERRYDA